MYRVSGRQIAAALAFLAALLGAAPAVAQPSLSHVSPGALPPGKTTELTLHGTKLDGPLRVWTSFPAQIELLPANEKQQDKDKQQDNKQAVSKITLSAGAPVGIGGIAIANAEGVSEVLYLMIDDLPSIAMAAITTRPLSRRS